MILPGKYLSHDRALINIGADILSHLEEPCSISELWERVRLARQPTSNVTSLSFDWFVLALNLLYALFAIDYQGELVRKQRPI